MTIPICDLWTTSMYFPGQFTMHICLPDNGEQICIKWTLAPPVNFLGHLIWVPTTFSNSQTPTLGGVVPIHFCSISSNKGRLLPVATSGLGSFHGTQVTLQSHGFVTNQHFRRVFTTTTSVKTTLWFFHIAFCNFLQGNCKTNWSLRLTENSFRGPNLSTLTFLKSSQTKHFSVFDAPWLPETFANLT